MKAVPATTYNTMKQFLKEWYNFLIESKTITKTMFRGQADNQARWLPDHLRSAKTEYSVLNIWAMYCGPCKKEMPWFKQIIEKLPNVTFFSAVGEGHKGYSGKMIINDVAAGNMKEWQGPAGKTIYLYASEGTFTSYPQTFLFKNGKLIAKAASFKSALHFVKFLKSKGVIKFKQNDQPQSQPLNGRSDKYGKIKLVKNPWTKTKTGSSYKNEAIYVQYKNIIKGFILFRKDSDEDANTFLSHRLKGKIDVRDALRNRSGNDGLLSGIPKITRQQKWPNAKLLFVQN